MASHGILVTGTDTGVGKTVVTCALIRQAQRQGLRVAGMKPVASGMQELDGEWFNEDVAAIARTMDLVIDKSIINPYAYRPFIAPHLAAAEAGEQIHLEQITGCYEQLAAQTDLVIVEGAGGLMTPLNSTKTFLDLAVELSLSVVLVVAVRLGCINHALLTALALQTAGVHLLGWVANYPDPSAVSDSGVEATLQSRLVAPCLGVIPYHRQAINEADIAINHIVDYLT